MKKKIIFGIIALVVALFFVIGIPFIINELYKTGNGYITMWGAEDVLAYYEAILGAVATVLAVVFTIRFTKKQIQRENYLQREVEKWAKIEAVFADILNQLNPIDTLRDIMDTGFTAPDKAINILQKYQMTCRTITDHLITNLSTLDYPKVKNLIESIQTTSEQIVVLAEKQIEQYGLQQKLALSDNVVKILDLANDRPGSLTPEEMAEYQRELDATKNIRFENIEDVVSEINANWTKLYETDYRNLLALKGSTFEGIYTEIQKNADDMLHLREKS